jgi:hypothetical protein
MKRVGMSRERAVLGALKATIRDHGPITAALVTSATKRVIGNLQNAGAVDNLLVKNVERAFEDVARLPGYRDTALERIRAIAAALKEGAPVPSKAFDWLVDALERIANGKDLGRAFGLPARRPGRAPSEDTLNELNVLARAVHSYHLQGAPMNDSKEVDGAFKLAAKHFSTPKKKISPATARLAWEVWGDSIAKMMWRQGPPNLKPLRRKRKPK